jgi:hypothetical protein
MFGKMVCANDTLAGRIQNERTVQVLKFSNKVAI